jgi:hypothetical protein
LGWIEFVATGGALYLRGGARSRGCGATGETNDEQDGDDQIDDSFHDSPPLGWWLLLHAVLFITKTGIVNCAKQNIFSWF